ncbi:MAG TPA: HAMP domain-containing sensor histidine kinase [Candidatus Deferrimicrobiaceae bacterium]|nr:HAMP domain-containing sensor histidine kinase [Candidatus Deferrimicrobiaceae bacterium]
MDRNRVENYRLSLFGQMVMGVSHEVDNYLSVILGFAELIQISGGGEKKTLDGVGKILNAGERINVIIRHFSQYVRPHSPVRERFSPGEALRECLVFSKYDLGRNNVALQLPESFPQGMVNADRRDFALILLALLFNGSEAMAAKGGALRLSVSLKDGNWEFVVADEGPGIPPEIASRVFEEGFTTKTGPEHSGIGLPLARYLAAEMGGTVFLADAPSGGCEAVLRIPENGSPSR